MVCYSLCPEFESIPWLGYLRLCETVLVNFVLQMKDFSKFFKDSSIPQLFKAAENPSQCIKAFSFPSASVSLELMLFGVLQRLLFRVPTVLENQGKSWKNLWSWKVMEKSWKIKKMSKVMEK